MKVIVLFSAYVLLFSNCAAEIPVENLSFPRETSKVESFSEFYSPVEFSSAPSMNLLELPLNSEEVVNLMDVLNLTGQAIPPALLISNGFAVFPEADPTDNPVTSFHRLGDTGHPIFVSSGILFHLLHIFFDQTLQQVEIDYLYSDLLAICNNLYLSNMERGNSLNAAFFAVHLKFLDTDFSPHSSIANEVNAEVALMQAHQGFAISPIFGYEEDYSQYVPRGHYTASEELENYFMAMMYMGRLTFLLNGGASSPVSEEAARMMTEAALLIVSDLNIIQVHGAPLKEKWARIYGITAFFAGFADDLSVPQYQVSAEAVLGQTTDSSTLHEKNFQDNFKLYIAENFPGPSIYSGTGESAAGDPSDFKTVLASTAGFRFFGQRYAPDSEILGKFVFPSILPNPSGEPRHMPSGLDVAASFSCAAALDALMEDGTMLYEFYPDTLTAMQEMVDNYTDDNWHATLYMSWLHSLKLLASPRGSGYPTFMQTDAWNRCTLSTFLSSWAMLRHDTILYVKQSYTPRQHIATVSSAPSAGFVEPVPEVYAELLATLQMAQRGIEFYGISDNQLTSRFAKAETLLATLQSIAERELAGEMLTLDDACFLKGFAKSLEAAISNGENTDEGLETSLIADVHTDQNSGTVLEVASGNLDICVVLYKRADGVVEAAIGPVLSYYQFAQPQNNRLTDDGWRNISTAEHPARPAWTKSYIVE